ncbi:MAG: hypothetical protein ACYDH5_18940 [Acidimicrobiales bacterium]
MRAGADYFVTPAEPAQRRYEALRSYFVDDASAAEVGSRFGYSPATVHQLAAELRAGRTQFFLSSKPGPRGPRKTGRIHDQVLALRAEDHSVTDIAERVSMDGTPVSAQSVWAILHAEGIERLGRSHAGPPPRLDPVKAAPIGDWPASAVFDCDHAGLYVLLPALVELGIDKLIGAARYPGTKVLSPFHFLTSLLLVKCSRRGRAANAFPLGADAGLGLVMGLSAVPNADVTKADQAKEIIAFADYWARVVGTDPGLLVVDSKVTTYKTLDELAARGITFLTLRQRGAKVLEALAALPSSAWSTYNLKRAGRYSHPQIHEEIIHLKGIEIPLRQIAVRNIGHEHPTLLITNDLATAAKDLFGRYAERMIIENELDADISGFHLNALASGLPLNVDLDTTLTVLAGNAYRLLARKLPRYEQATPDRLWHHFADNTGKVVVNHDHVRVDLAVRTYTPVLIDAGYPELDLPVPSWGGRTLRFGFPPR